MLFENYQQTELSTIIGISGEKLTIEGIGLINLTLDNNQEIRLKEVLYVPGAHQNVVSVSKATAKGAKVTISENDVELSDKVGIIATAKKRAGLYYLDLAPGYHKRQDKKCYTESKEGIIKQSSKTDINYWHNALGHINEQAIKNTIKGVTGKLVECEACLKTKAKKLKFENETIVRPSKTLELIVTDIAGPMEVAGLNGERYFGVIVDAATDYTHVAFLKTKSEMIDYLEEFAVFAENQTGKKIKRIKTDNGAELTSTRTTQWAARIWY
jgi:hypothetical protein